MVIPFLLTVLIAFVLAGCTPTGAPGQTTVIVVTATASGSVPGAGAQPADPYAAPTATLPPAAAAPNTAPTGTTAANPPAATATTAPPPAPAQPSPTTAAAAPAVPATGAEVQVSFDQLLDYNVVDANGNLLGEVKDAVVDRAANNGLGQVTYLVVDSNLKEDFYIPVPWNKAQVRPDFQAVMLPVNATQLAAAPGFNDELWPANFGGANNAVQTFWANPGQGGAAAPVLPGGPGLGGSYLRASDVLSLDILNQQGVKLGEIKDVAIDWKNSQPNAAQAAQFRFLLMEMNDDFGFENRIIPLPWAAVRVNPGQENVVVNLPQNRLLTAPNFLQGSLPDLYAEPWSSQLSQFWP